ncbi:MAG: iron-containing alcohol dehydrogenase, partial [Candidatus Competibacteraceae bacterium]|nr:iron-containing alcohol dehydrogenase [Candidatus Competibacteraceae bacterium]
MEIPSFTIARLPRIEFGFGVVARLPELLAAYGDRILLVTGTRSFAASSHWQTLVKELGARGVTWEHLTVSGEPSPELVDGAVERWGQTGIRAVAGIGGGSVLDAAKAIAGLLAVGDSVLNYLETHPLQQPYRGPALPLIAVPTTAGTGSEATKNAVLSRQGPEGFKKSFRHERLVPEVALVDPDLLSPCPREQIAANAMDALTQLMESYTSLKANPLTDALAESGIQALREGLFHCFEGGEDAVRGRAALAYAALLSGICLAQTGLGAVHGLASPLGALFPIPHGVVCGTLVAATTRANIRALRERAPEDPVRDKFARLGNLLSEKQHQNPRNARETLSRILEDWTERLEIPRLGRFGIRQGDIPAIVAKARGSSMKTNPIVLTDGELSEIL